MHANDTFFLYTYACDTYNTYNRLGIDITDIDTIQSKMIIRKSVRETELRSFRLFFLLPQSIDGVMVHRVVHTDPYTALRGAGAHVQCNRGGLNSDPRYRPFIILAAGVRNLPLPSPLGT